MSEPKGVSIQPHELYLLATVVDAGAGAEALAAAKEHILTASQAHPGLPVFLDLSAVQVLPSVSLGDLLQIKNGLASRKQRLLLLGVQPEIRRTLAITHLDKLFEIHDTAATALAHLQAPR